MKSIAVVLLLQLGLFMGCESQDTDFRSGQLPLNEDVVFAYKQVLSNDAHNLSLAFTDIIGDSRCPEMKENQVDCFWEGDGHVRFKMKTSDQEHILDLHTTLTPKDTIVGKFRVTLVRLDPYPTSTDPIPAADYRSTIRVELAN